MLGVSNVPVAHQRNRSKIIVVGIIILEVNFGDQSVFHVRIALLVQRE